MSATRNQWLAGLSLIPLIDQCCCGAVGKRLEQVVGVEALPFERNEQIARLDRPAIGIHSTERHIRRGGFALQRCCRLRERHHRLGHAAPPRLASAACHGGIAERQFYGLHLLIFLMTFAG